MRRAVSEVVFVAASPEREQLEAERLPSGVKRLVAGEAGGDEGIEIGRGHEADVTRQRVPSPISVRFAPASVDEWQPVLA